MSGLCGIIRFDGKTVQKEEVKNMCDSMKNRGNDATGIWVEGSAGLGHKMFWTTPESLHENQPLLSADNKLIITADARIDNRKELFEKLKIKENEFDVLTDIDLILGAYQKWGKECPKYLIGDFTFVIWDQGKKELFAAKDKLGMKPFYYYYDNEVFLFASEVLVLRQILNEKAEVKKDSVRNWIHYMSIGYEHTFFENIKRLPFASILSYKQNDIILETYWQPQEMKISYDISYAEACSRFKTLFEQAVKDRLRSAYPVGCELSGGLDSSSVLCVAAQTKEGKDILPFSLRFGEMSCDEGNFIEAVEQQTGISSHTVDVNAMDTDTSYSLERYYRQFSDWPQLGSFLPHLALAKQAQKKGVRILLTGQGGDNIATGNYYGILDDLKRIKFKTVWETLSPIYGKKRLVRLLLFRVLPNKIINMLRNIKHGRNPFCSKILIDKKNFFDLGDAPELFSDFALGYDVNSIWGASENYWKDSNPYQHLGQIAVDALHPYLDSRLVEFMLQLPPSYKYKYGMTKRVLRDGMKDILPELVRNRRDKAVFCESVRAQFSKELLMKNTTEFTLVKEGLLSQEEMQKVIDIYHSGAIENMLHNSMIVNLEIWYNKINADRGLL